MMNRLERFIKEKEDESHSLLKTIRPHDKHWDYKAEAKYYSEENKYNLEKAKAHYV